MKIPFAPSDMLNKQVTALGNDQFLLCLESHDNEDYCSTDHWDQRDVFVFSSNIDVVAATKMVSSVAVIVQKKNPLLAETITINDPDSPITLVF